MALTKVPLGMTDASAVNPMQLGAKFDGVTDDTVAIQAALDSMPAGGTILFPRAKPTVVSASLSVRINTTLDINFCTIKQAPNSKLDSLVFVGAISPDSAVINGTLDLNVGAQGYARPKSDTGRGVFIYKASGVRVEGIRVRNPYGAMILSAAASHVIVTRCDINDRNGTGHSGIEFNSCTDCDATWNTGLGKVGITGYGIYAHGPTVKVRALDNQFQYWQIVFPGDDYLSAGVPGAVPSMIYCRIDRNTLLDPSADTSIHFGLYGSVCDNIIINSRDVGISMDYSRNIVVSNNVLRTTNAAGIALPGCIDMIVTGNMLSNVGSQWVKPVDNGQRCGIWVPIRPFESAPSITPSGNVISDNTIRDAQATPTMWFGISVANVGGTNVNYVRGNYITGSVGADLDVPVQTNIGVDQAKKYPVILNGWADYANNFAPTSFYKDDIGTVFVSGVVKGGTLSTVVATLPVGFRPVRQLMFMVMTNTGPGRLDVFPSGDIMLVSGGLGFVSLCGINFSVR